MPKQLMKIKPLVLEILTEYPDTRNSDSLLYAKVLEQVAVQNGTADKLYGVNAWVFLHRAKEWGFPNTESVRRARQKIQAECPWLRADAAVQAKRAELEQDYRAFARGEGA